jgi:hypothetical protein
MEAPSSGIEHRLRSMGSTRVGRRSVTVLCVIAFLVIVLASCIRVARHMNVPGVVDNQQWALIDFRDAIYYPTVSFLGGDNPYNSDTFVARYPVRVGFPPYAPLFLLVHVPFGLLPHIPSQLMYFVLTIALTLVLAWLSLWMCGRRPKLASVTGIAALILASRPGHWNLMLGQTTVPLVLLVYIALWSTWRSPWLSGLAFVGPTMKATFCLPLTVVMIAQKQYRAVVIGVSVAVLATLIPVAVLVHSAGDFATLASTYLESIRDLEDDPAANAVVSTARMDAIALVGRLSGRSPGPASSLLLFAFASSLAGATIWRVRKRAPGREAELFCISVASVMVLVATYQLTYSALLLVLPLMALLLDCWAPSELMAGSAARRVLIVLLAVPFANHLIAPRFLHLLERGSWGLTLLVSMNGMAMLLAFGVYVWVAFRSPRNRCSD